EDKTDKVLSFLDEVADIREHQIDARQMLLGCEGYAGVDDQPLPATFVAKPVDRQVHADLADTAERRENELVRQSHYERSPVGTVRASPKYTSPAAIAQRVSSDLRRIRQPCSSSVSNIPCSVRSPMWMETVLPTPCARSSQSRRIAANPRPRSHRLSY